MTDVAVIQQIIDTHHFTNLHSENDRGFRETFWQIVHPCQNDPGLLLKLAIAVFTNQPEALRRIDWGRPADSEFLPYVKGVLQDYQGQGGSVFRTVAYKYPMPPELRGMNALDCLFDVVLAPMQRVLDELRPRTGDTLEAVHIRPCGCHGVGEFLSGQIIRYLKYAEPLKSASDWETFVARGPGSERGLNLLYGRPITAKWSRPLFCAAIEKARQQLNPELAKRGIAPLDGQNTNNLFCETFKLHRAIERGGKPSRPYKPSNKPMPPPIPGFESRTDTAVKASDTNIKTTAETSANCIDPADKTETIPQHILNDQPGDTIEQKANETGPEPAPVPQPPPGDDNRQRRHSSTGSSPHGDPGPPRGAVKSTFLYDHPDQPMYLLVEKRIDTSLPDGRAFFQYHWAGRWVPGVKGTYAERKVPYQLCALKAALAADPDVVVNVTEGEKDADTLHRLGFVATTNPGGAAHWNDDCTAWLRILGVRRIVLHEDNDTAGRERTGYLAPALSGFAKVRVAHYPDVPDGEDVTWWIEEGHHTREDLATRIADAKAEAPATPVDLWAQFEPPLLPADLLPKTIGDFAAEQGALIGADPAGLAMAALAVGAAAIPDPIKLKVKHYGGWMESARLWSALVGLASTKKTPIINAAARPLAAIDTELYRVYAEAKHQWEALPAKERRAAPRPKQVRVRLEDTTIEAAQEVLRDSPDGVLCLQDELSGWFGSMDKYVGHRGAAKDRGFWLQAYNGGSYTFDRITRGSGLIENLSMSLLGGIQPEPMRKISADTVDDGLIQRIVPVMLRPATMSRDAEFPAAAATYSALIQGLHSLTPPTAPIQFSDAALAFRAECEKRHLDLMTTYEALNKKFAAHVGKYDGIFARLCLTWHCIEAVERRVALPAVITEDTARRVASFLHGFLLPHAVAFYTATFGLGDNHDQLAAVAGYILAHKVEILTNRVIARGDAAMRGLVKDKRGLDSVYHQLEALGWIERTPNRRPSDPPWWKVNPEVHRLFAERARQERERRRCEREVIAAFFQKQKQEGPAA
jgi:hypothetical protein